MSLVIRILHCYFVVHFIILGVHQLTDWPSLVYSPWLWEIRVLSVSQAHDLCAWLLIIFVMYYSNPQVNYMVTVFIRLVIAVVYTLHLLSCSECFVCLCLFQYRHCFLVSWCTNKSYVIATSDLWLFIDASNLLTLNSPPHSPTCVLVHRGPSGGLSM